MILFNKDTEKEIVVIAEIGLNHMGSLDWIFKMLPRLKQVGVDAVKFQLFTPELYVSKNDNERFSKVSALALSESIFLQIKKECDNINLPIFATPLSHDWVQFISDTCGNIKIASGDFTFSQTVDLALNSPSNIIISSGATSRQEVIDFVNKAKKIRTGDGYSNSVAILHCVSSYPASISELNLSAIKDLRAISGLTIGFSSHFIEDAPLFAAIGAGARIIEIHVTDDRTRTDIRDHALSRTPEELETIICLIRELNLSLKSEIKTIQKSEYSAIPQMRKGLIYIKDLQVGHHLTVGDLSFARPMNTDFKDMYEIVGRVVTRPVLAFHSVKIEYLS